MRLLISDANILIDIEEGGLVDALFRLPFSFMVPDLLFFDELEEQHAHLPGLGLRLGELQPEAISEAERLAGSYRGPSRYDCLALALAKQERCPLITGDRDLTKAAKAERVATVGTLWLVEQIVVSGLISPEQAREAYTRMREAGSRLPWGEAEGRLLEIERGEYRPRDPFEEAGSGESAN